MGRPENFYLNNEGKYPSGRVRYVQRIRRREHGNKNYEGVDAHFSFDYMGAAEFEWGALPNSLKEMRGMKKMLRKLPKPVLLKVKPDELQMNLSDLEPKLRGNAFKAYYFGPPEFVDGVREFFRRELQKHNGEDYPNLKEWTEIARAYGLEKAGIGKDPNRIVTTDINGWWDIENHWVMFMDESDANKWRDAVMVKPKKKDAA